jgi:hypothetical membrane protein
MVESVVVGIGLLVVATAGCIGAAAWRFAATGARPLLPLAGAAAALAGVFALGQVGDVFRPTRASAMTVLSVFAALALAVQWYRER